MPKDDTRKTFNCFRAVIEILLDITKDEEEYARLYKAVREEKYYENGGTGRLSEPLKEDIEKSRKKDQEYLLGLLHYNSTKEISCP
jgi:hypothetical protein